MAIQPVLKTSELLPAARAVVAPTRSNKGKTYSPMLRVLANTTCSRSSALKTVVHRSSLVMEPSDVSPPSLSNKRVARLLTSPKISEPVEEPILSKFSPELLKSMNIRVVKGKFYLGNSETPLTPFQIDVLVQEPFFAASSAIKGLNPQPILTPLDPRVGRIQQILLSKSSSYSPPLNSNLITVESVSSD
jgi:hypothetical protein